MNVQHIYLVGSQRSGTTLLRLILESHPLVFCYDELLAYEALTTGSIKARGGATHVVFKIPRWTEQLLDPVVWDYGEPATGPQFYQPGEKVIFLVRDPKATVGSMMKLPGPENRWLDSYPAPIMRERIARDEQFAKRYRTEFEQAQRSASAAVATGALYWKYKSEAFFDYMKAGLPLGLVHYESLVTQPEAVLRPLCQFLGLPWDNNLLQHEWLQHTELFADGRTVGGTDPRVPIHSRSVDAWRAGISVAEAAEIDRISDSLHTRFKELFAGKGVVVVAPRHPES